MPAVWDNKVTFVSVSPLVGVSLCIWTLRNSTSYYLTWGTKKSKNKRGTKMKK